MDIILFSMRWHNSLWCMNDSQIFECVGSKQIGQYDCLHDLKPFCFKIAVMFAILNMSGRKPSLNISLNIVLSGNEIGVTIKYRNLLGMPQCD